MKAITICVDYSDYLAVTLPKNRHYFEEYMIVTTPDDLDTLQVAADNECQIFTTNSFFDNAYFNKYLPLEQGLTSLGREGWLCILDADIVLPDVLTPFPQQTAVRYDPFYLIKQELVINNPLNLSVGNLYVPKRCLANSLVSDWSSFVPQEEEFAGYCQIFHASDCGKPPWHQTNWKHAGGADSFFAMKWRPDHRLRPNFNVLHLGIPGVNWCGRTTPIHGELPQKAEERAAALKRFLSQRKTPHHKFKHEKF